MNGLGMVVAWPFSPSVALEAAAELELACLSRTCRWSVFEVVERFQTLVVAGCGVRKEKDRC